jgi:ammonium transporter, Amt family
MNNIVMTFLQAAPLLVVNASETVATAAVAAAEETEAITLFTANNIWMMLATALVFIMHLGFAGVETGLTRSKNTVNVLFKNTITPAIGLLTYALVGFSLMYPGFEEGSNGWFGFAGWGLTLPENGTTSAYNPGYTFWTDFLFQGMFAATCATIVSGAVAERIKLEAYVIFTLIYVSLIYPVIGSWKWGLGWLNTLEFYDFAGSTLVHSVGGWGALAGVIILGARAGKYVDGKIHPIPGHSMPLAVMGVFLLWLGWFGFNGGSVLSADPAATSLVLVTTSLAASAGAIGAMLTSFLIFKKHDLSMTLNGILGGLVGITAGADQMGVLDSVLIGLISGLLVVVAVILFDRARLDDPVGALSVHLVCGIFGTLAVGIFGAKAGWSQFVSQLIGVAAAGAASFAFAFAIFYVIKVTMGIRVSRKEETQGLDSFEHGMAAYTPSMTNELPVVH